MATTIQISNELQQELSKKKLMEKETYEEVIWAILEDSEELSEQTKRDIKEAREEIKHGKLKTLEQVEKELEM
ncbi:MAG: hypothetical protein KKA62_03845 [Nanoarchaeota archaeon]|nr:hypothetical protein [Nanoarchaeota archaeon]MBU1643787.1 hypothetical protein [Nanoarchaeota archaeon]MBU1977058.1 hypothetical protein [Nanoarchaeota archaeon]